MNNQDISQRVRKKLEEMGLELSQGHGYLIGKHFQNENPEHKHAIAVAHSNSYPLESFANYESPQDQRLLEACLTHRQTVLSNNNTPLDIATNEENKPLLIILNPLKPVIGRFTHFPLEHRPTLEEQALNLLEFLDTNSTVDVISAADIHEYASHISGLFERGVISNVVFTRGKRGDLLSAETEQFNQIVDGRKKIYVLGAYTDQIGYFMNHLECKGTISTTNRSQIIYNSGFNDPETMSDGLNLTQDEVIKLQENRPIIRTDTVHVIYDHVVKHPGKKNGPVLTKDEMEANLQLRGAIPITFSEFTNRYI